MDKRRLEADDSSNVEEGSAPLLDKIDKSSTKKNIVEDPSQKAPPTARTLIFCFIGLQASYLTWGYVQEKVMTREYTTGRFPSATFCVFSNRAFAVVVAGIITCFQHKGQLSIPASIFAFAPCALSNSLSSFGQYQALRYVSFPLQTISKSTKVIPVMLMGKVLNGKSYPCTDYIEAMVISAGVSVFSLAKSGGETDFTAGSSDLVRGVSMLALYIVADSFTSQWQSRLYRSNPNVDQFQMMFAVNFWAITMTLAALVGSGELWTTLQFLVDNPAALVDNVTIAITSATGQLFIFYTIRTFGPVVFTIIMTTRQMFSICLSLFLFGHTVNAMAGAGALAVFATIFHRIKRQSAYSKQRAPTPQISSTSSGASSSSAMSSSNRK